MSKQTAVEWLGFELNRRLFFKVSEKEWDEIKEVFKQALIMEREQIIEAAERWKGTNFAEKYYNETYKGGEQ